MVIISAYWALGLQTVGSVRPRYMSLFLTVSPESSMVLGMLKAFTKCVKWINEPQIVAADYLINHMLDLTILIQT